jgi:hypothetical protein
MVKRWRMWRGCSALVDERDRVVLVGDVDPFSLVSSWSRPRTELAVRSPTENNPDSGGTSVEVAHAFEHVEIDRSGTGLGLVRIGKLWRVDKALAGGDLQAAGAADHETALRRRRLTASSSNWGPATLASGAIFSGWSAMAVTAWPRPESSLRMREPALPDAPTSAIFMNQLLRARWRAPALVAPCEIRGLADVR